MYTGLDYFRADDWLTDEEKMVRQTTRQVTEDEVLPVIKTYHRKGEFPVELVAKMGALGFLGATLTEEFGCAGMNNLSYGLVMQELERGDSAIRSFASLQSALVMYPIFKFGSDQQKEYWIPRLASGAKIGCFG